MKLRRIYSQKQKKPLDLILLSTVAALVLFGLVVVYDVSIAHASQDFGDSYYYIRQQIIWVILGVAVALFFANFDYHHLRKLSPLALLASLIMLVAVFIPGLGTSAGGAHRWLNIGIGTLQPAELVKLTSVIWLAAIFEKGPKLKLLVGLVVIVVAIMGILQKDLGSTIVFVLTSLIIYIVSGGAIIQLLLLAPLGIIGLLALILTSEYRKKRVAAFLDPFSDPQGFTYHISQVLIALGSGGFLGLGLGQSRQKFYIPEVTTDSIFAVIGEELGFVGAAVLIALFIGLVLRGFKIAEEAGDQFGRVLAIGLTSWLGIQAIINLSAMVAFMPLTGVPLPFISYGGSALVANLMAVGILLNISKKS